MMMQFDINIVSVNIFTMLYFYLLYILYISMFEKGFWFITRWYHSNIAKTLQWKGKPLLVIMTLWYVCTHNN